jgi:pSer/pThr/pTyr-binding forkhead associated (FHA) protein
MPSNRSDQNIKLVEGRSFIIGRQGHIFIDSITASNHHAEIRVVNQKIYLRDLDSTNGTYLLQNGAKRRFHKGYVKPQQTIVIGGKPHTVLELLAIARDFGDLDGARTEIQIDEDSLGDD